MVTFILPGYSANNKKWADDCASGLKLGHEIRPIYWAHWDDPSIKWNPEEKVRLIVDVARDNQINIVAKSIGTLVASMIIEKVPEKVQKVVMCGVPLGDINLMSEDRKEVYRKVLADFPEEKLIVFQNTEDPLASFEEVKIFMMKINPKIKVIEKDRSDHEYPYYDEFKEFLQGTLG